MKLYVGNLPFQTTEADLRDLFGQFGTVTDAVVMLDRMSGRSRGFGFVTMSNSEQGQAAINGTHGKDLQGRSLTVNEARPREERPFAGGGGGGYRGGGRHEGSYGGRRRESGYGQRRERY